MKVVLKPGEEITIEFDGTDGEITVAFDKKGLRVDVDDYTVFTENFVREDEKEEKPCVI
jgi:hypothetical protein